MLTVKLCRIAKAGEPSEPTREYRFEEKSVSVEQVLKSAGVSTVGVKEEHLRLNNKPATLTTGISKSSDLLLMPDIARA